MLVRLRLFPVANRSSKASPELCLKLQNLQHDGIIHTAISSARLALGDSWYGAMRRAVATP